MILYNNNQIQLIQVKEKPFNARERNSKHF